MAWTLNDGVKEPEYNFGTKDSSILGSNDSDEIRFLGVLFRVEKSGHDGCVDAANGVRSKGVIVAVSGKSLSTLISIEAAAGTDIFARSVSTFVV